MGRRKGRKRPTRLEKIAAAKKSGKTIVATGHRKPGQAEVIRPDFKNISLKSRKMIAGIAQCMGKDPKTLYNKV